MKNNVQLEIPFETKEWRPVVGYEGLYEISSLGRVKNRSGKIMKPGTYTGGYLRVDLCKDGKAKLYKVHRLVAEAFIPNPNNLPCVNHKDCNRTNNHVDNLEWCSWAYNNNYGNCKRKMILSRNANGRKNAEKQVKQMSIDGSIIRIWKSMAEAGRNGFDQRNICSCCKGRYKTAYGYKWEYA